MVGPLRGAAANAAVRKSTTRATPKSKKPVGQKAVGEITTANAGKENKRSKPRNTKAAAHVPDKDSGNPGSGHVPVDPSVLSDDLPPEAVERLKYLEGQYSNFENKYLLTYSHKHSTYSCADTRTRKTS